MKMSKHYKKLCLVLGLTGILGATAVTAQSGTQNLQATYRNIRVTYNGVTQNIANEPFLVNGSTYVPLRAIGDIFGANATWDPASNTVILAGGSASSNSDEITQLNYQIAALQKELSEANAELAQYKANSSTGSISGTTSGSNITVQQIEAMEDTLNNEFADYFSGISFDFDLKKSSSRFILSISYNKSAQNNAFDKLGTRQIDFFLETVCEAITQRHQGMSIEGTIAYNSTDKYTFTYTKAGSYSGEAVIELEESDIEDYILDEYSTLDSTGIDSITVKDVDVSVNDSKSSITCKLYIKTPSQEDMTTWSGRSSDKALKNDLSIVAESIQSEFNTSYDILFTLVDETDEDRIASWKDGDLSLYSWN